MAVQTELDKTSSESKASWFKGEPGPLPLSGSSFRRVCLRRPAQE